MNASSPRINNSELVSRLLKIAHDLRSPFATFQSFLNILEMDNYQVSAEELKDMAMQLQKNNETSLKKVDTQIKELIEILNTGAE